MLLIDTISVVLIAKNAEDTIEETLKSVTSFKNVVLYLNNSSDSTEEIAKTYKNIDIVHGDFLGFGPSKNKAASYAKSEWILSLDSDEVLGDSLVDELKLLRLDNNKEVFVLKRDNYFLGKEVKHSGWGKDKLVRLYNKSCHEFNQNIVHEFIVLKADTIQTKLRNSFKHNAVQNINQFLHKIMKYSDLGAKDKKTCSFIVVFFKAHYAFFKTYIMQFGFLDGWRGFVIAVSNFNGTFFRYTKRYINCKIK